jgi:hypothetical protein
MPARTGMPGMSGPGQALAPVDPSATRLDQSPGQQGQPGQFGQPGQYGQPGQFGQPGQYGQPGQFGQQGQFGQPGQPGLPGQPPPPRPMPAAAPEPKPERKGRLIIGVLVGCATLLAVAFGGLVLLDKLVGPPFVVGDCVKQSADKQEAVAAACSDEGAYKVVSTVSSADECDKEQPFVKLEDEILCLQPASGEAPAASPAPTPSQ